MRGIHFHLNDKMPKYMSLSMRKCRALCGHVADHMLEAVGTDYSYPCCPTIECQEAVKNQILADMAKDKVLA